MQKYLLILILFAFLGCARTISYESVAHPDKRILFEGLSFYPPSGENWEMESERIGGYIAHETFGRSLVIGKRFKKTIIGQNQAPETTETIWVEVLKHRFAIMDFDNTVDLKDLVQSRYEKSKKLGEFVLESNTNDVKYKGMKCIKDDTKMKIGRKASSSIIAFIRYVQEYGCVYPKNPKQVIELRAIQELPKGQTPTNIQNELDYFFNSLEVHDLP